jgi:hypothetical protein
MRILEFNLFPSLARGFCFLFRRRRWRCPLLFIFLEDWQIAAFLLLRMLQIAVWLRLVVLKL